uniref:Flagellar protein FliT n=1 Tax=Cohnella candidum TaxID=2674991 RepID=A0A3G3K102_9BACL|nr:hypothetical protein EAV92_17125 [Cohnella candidum]
MIRSDVSVHDAFRRMIETSEAILELDLEEEEDAERLGALQARQVALRVHIERAWSSAYRNDPEIHALTEKAYESERQVNDRLKAARQMFSNHLSKIQVGSRMKNAYHHEYSQAEGYFFDRKK